MYETRIELRFGKNIMTGAYFFNVERIFVGLLRLEAIGEELKRKIERMNGSETEVGILPRLAKIDIKRFTFIDDGDVDKYEPYRVEAIALRVEYNQLEGEVLVLLEEQKPLMEENNDNFKQFEIDKEDGKLETTPAEQAPYYETRKTNYGVYVEAGHKVELTNEEIIDFELMELALETGSVKLTVQQFIDLDLVELGIAKGYIIQEQIDLIVKEMKK